MPAQRVLIATHNPGKLREYQELLGNLPAKMLTLADLSITEAPEETGTSFEENARLKAQVYAHTSGLLTLAEDSGLEVDALGGAPGVHSARYGGETVIGDKARYHLVLDNLQSIPDSERTARFRCVVALATPEGDIYTTEGTCEGHIAHKPVGEQGFGYDPIFIVVEQGVTMAQLSSSEKNQISHRARALQAIRPTLVHLLNPHPGE